ncbi:MAG: hypothetical protein KGI27_10080 [Thaumarchaeota archaeon]|nr:hypothetical protein [Nitrososphaerota archaeon]
MTTYGEKFLQLFTQLEQDLEIKISWLSKQDLTLAQHQYHQGYINALKDTLDFMKVLVDGHGKPQSLLKLTNK